MTFENTQWRKAKHILKYSVEKSQTHLKHTLQKKQTHFKINSGEKPNTLERDSAGNKLLLAMQQR